MDYTHYRKYVVPTPPDNVKKKNQEFFDCRSRKMKTGAYRKSPYSCKMEFKEHDDPWEQVCYRVPSSSTKDDLPGRRDKKWVNYGLLPPKIKKLWRKGHTYDVGAKDRRQQAEEGWGAGLFWDRPKICIGYRLKNNPSVFRPIFNQKLQLNINLFQKNIKRVVDKRMEKHVYIELFKIKQFPKVIVDKIFKMVY